MAVQQLTSSEVTNAQVQRLSKIQMAYQNATDIWGWFKKREGELNASGLKVPFIVSPNPSLGQVTGNGDVMPTAQAGNYDNFNVTYTGLQSGVAETLAALLNRTANTSEDVVKFEERESAKQFASFLNCYASRGDGTAALATISANYGTPSNSAATCNGTTDSIGTSQLVVGGYYTFWDATGATQRTGTVGAGAIQLSSKTGTVATFASNIPSDVVSTDIICPQITTTDATGGLYGLPIIDDAAGTYYGKARASYNGLASYEKTSAGTVTAGMLAETYSATAQRGGYFNGQGGTTLEDSLWLVMNQGNANMYYNLSLNSGSVVGGPMQLNHVGSQRPSTDIGLQTLTNMTWFGAPIKVGNNVRGDEIYFINPSLIEKLIFKDVGSIINGMPASDFLQDVDGSGDYLNARLKYNDFWGALYSPEPFKLGKISGITLTAPTQKATNVT